jgi:DNA polymerase-4
VPTIAHLDMDAFFVSVELQRHPELRGKPVIVAGSSPRAVVTTASYEARRYGVASATPAAHAQRLCPQAVRIAPDFVAYRSASARIMDILRSHVDQVEVVGLDEAYLDLTGMLAPRAGMARVASDIREQTGLECSIGIGPNKLIAKLASECEKPRGRVMLTREAALERFASAPPRLLPGIGPKTAERLEGLGIKTVRQLGSVRPEELTARFGSALGRLLHRRARLDDGSPVSAGRAAVSRSTETTFPTDVSDPEVLEDTLRRLSGQLAGILRDRGLRARTVGIKVRLDDFTTITRARTEADPIDDLDRLASTAVELLRTYGPPRPVRLLGVRASSLAAQAEASTPEEDQLSLPLTP